jgi:hypothetical protein
MTTVSVVLHVPGGDRLRVGASALEALARVPARCLASQLRCAQAGPRQLAGTLYPLLAGVASLMNSPFTRQGGLPRRAVTRRTGDCAAPAARSGSRVASWRTAKRPTIFITKE